MAREKERECVWEREREREKEREREEMYDGRWKDGLIDESMMKRELGW